MCVVVWFLLFWLVMRSYEHYQMCKKKIEMNRFLKQTRKKKNNNYVSLSFSFFFLLLSHNYFFYP